MCGIVGYTGQQEAAPLLVTGLKLLEYRGYDSAGLVVMNAGKPQRVRSLGYVENLERALSDNGVRGTVGIAHTRWATHGVPHEKNAHPHSDATQTFFVVHNGIIENYEAIRNYVGDQVHYTSETDTEVIAHLLSFEYARTHSVEEAFKLVCARIRGSYGLAVVSSHEPEKIFFARYASPLLLGRGETGMFVCSDIAPLIGNCTHVVYLNDGEWGYVSPSGMRIYTKGGEEVSPDEHVVPESIDAETKGSYAHYMQKEMLEAPRVIQSALAGRLKAGQTNPHLRELDSCGAWSSCAHLRIIACGTSYHAALYGKYIIESVSHIPVTVEIASEFRYKTYLPVTGEIVIAISQSGETADTRAGVLLAKSRGIPTIGLVNVALSTIAREVDTCILLNAGPERSVASTKACISQSVVCALLALTRIADESIAEELRNALLELSTHASMTLSMLSKIDGTVRALAQADNIFCLGRGGLYAVALEAALKLKEVAYIHAEGYPGGELKHGSLALIDARVPTLAFVSRNELLRDKLLSNIAEVRSRGGAVVEVSNSVSEQSTYIQTPTVSVFVEPIIHFVAAHMITYAIGCARGTPIDKPRNLAKAVTVE